MELIVLMQQRDNIISFAKERLSNAQQMIFIEHFLMSITDADDPFPISGEKTMEWLGYTMKHKFKSFLEKNLKLNLDYKISFTRSNEKPINESGKDLGGRAFETFHLTLEAFKTLEMLARTKRGDEIRSYYPQLEKLIYEYGAYQHQKAMQEAEEKALAAEKRAQAAEQMTKNIEYTLDAEREHFARQLRRRVVKNNPKDVVYIYQENQNCHKIGETQRNISAREEEHRCSSSRSFVIYTKKCCNCNLLEKVTHHILDQFRYNPKREWFDIDFITAKTALDTAQLFLDGLVDNCHRLVSTDFYGKLEALINELQETDNIPRPEEIEEDLEMEDVVQEPETEIGTKVFLKDVRSPLDFDKFIEDCCILGDDLTAFSAEVYGAHRLWGRCCQRATKNALVKYLNERFKRAKILEKSVGARLASFMGFSLKPIVFQRDNPPSDIDAFIDDKCNISYSARISTKSMQSAFEEWKKETTDPDYQINVFEKNRLDKAFSDKFICSMVFTGRQSEYGYFGVELKNNTSTAGLKLAPKLQKPVVKIDLRTNEIVATYESQVAAGIANNITSSGMLSRDIKYKRPHGHYIYQFAERPAKTKIEHQKTIEPVVLKKNNQKKVVYKIDPKTNTILAEYTSITDAAREIGHSMSSMCYFIKRQTLLDDCFYSLEPPSQ
jgi:phage anti-repressor protein